MLEAKYYKDFRHNYVILKDVDSGEDSYQSRMIAENRITGLLSCQQRHIDGETLFYYDISSKQSLSSFCENGYVTINFLKKLLRQLQRTRESMADYLLTERCLLLKPEFVFMDMENEEFFFLYFPFETNENYVLSFMEYLTDRVDAEDDEAVDVSYKILQLLEREQFVLDEVLQWFEEDYTEVKESYEVNDAGQKEKSWIEDAEERDVISPMVKEKPRFVRKKAIMGIMGIISLLGILLFYIYINYDMTQQVLIYFYAVAAAGVILLLGCFGYLIYIKQIEEKRIGYFPMSEKEYGCCEEGGRLYQETGFSDAYQERQSLEYGNTVFIPWVENCENKLYGTGKGNKHHIDLSRLPLTVGKMAGSVDMVISDQSISRRHAKFSREGNKICMTDLNSTNGTFKNGLRLEPNTSEILEPGDEIRLGKLKFIYR